MFSRVTIYPSRAVENIQGSRKGLVREAGGGEGGGGEKESVKQMVKC